MTDDWKILISVLGQFAFYSFGIWSTNNQWIISARAKTSYRCRNIFYAIRVEGGQ